MNFAGFGLLPEAADRMTPARQFRDIGNRRGSAGSSRQNVRVSSEGETLLTVHHPTSRHLHECDPPLPLDEVERIAASAWQYQVTGQNRVGRGRYILTPEVRFELLMDKPDAFVFDTRMRFDP